MNRSENITETNIETKVPVGCTELSNYNLANIKSEKTKRHLIAGPGHYVSLNCRQNGMLIRKLQPDEL